jgi:hypothetical protein
VEVGWIRLICRKKMIREEITNLDVMIGEEGPNGVNVGLVAKVHP